MKSSNRWILYSLLRVGLFAVLFAVLYLLLPPEFWWIAAILATIIAFSVSYIFFREPRDELARDLQRRREQPEPDVDSDAENAALDAAENKSTAEKPETSEDDRGGER